MKLSVLHKTTYRYAEPARSVLQSQRLQPSVFDGQQVVDWLVTTEKGVRGAEFRDGAGDQTWLVHVPGPVEVVTVEVRGIVVTTDLAGVLRGHREKVPPMAYLRPTRPTRADVAIEELARDSVAAVARTAELDRAHALAKAVAEAIAYTPDATDAHTTAAEALAGKAGVCQDHAHVLIAMARTLDMPARYVTGYLFAGPADAAHPDEVRVGAQASHAWAEIHVDGLGWVGFDAANNCCPDDRYVRLCSGFDAFDAAPIRGLAMGRGDEDLEVAVAVEAVQQ